MSDEKRNDIYWRGVNGRSGIRRDDPEVQPPASHEGFYINVDGTTAHVLGDPNMSAEQLAALEKMIRAAIKMMKDEEDAERNNQAD